MNLPRLTPAGERAISAATEESQEFCHGYLGVEHVFLGAAAEEAERLAPAFEGSRTDLESFVDLLRQNMKSLPANPTKDFVISPRCRKVFKLSSRLTSAPGEAVGPTEMLTAILREGRSVPLRLLRAHAVDPLALEAALEPERTEPVKAPAETPLLNRFGRDLTALAREGRLSPVIGRNEEMDLVAQVLLRRNKNNPVLIGEAGVGKTAVVEGFARLLVSEACPAPLKNRRLVEVALGGLVAGTKFRGEFEERVLNLIKELQSNDDVIVFFDEIHTLVGAGATGSDSMDASNILKPALARGEVRCIGATTIDEYRHNIEKDPALERRFERVMVYEPQPSEALEILTRLTPVFEAHHEVEILPEAIDAAVELTLLHVHDRRLPDKALDAIDQACARRRLERYAGTGGEAPVKIGEADVARTVSQWTGVPLERLSPTAARELLDIEGRLAQLVLGQPHAVRAVANTILTARAGLAAPDRPLGVFLFTGPTGVGKTHLAKSLDRVLFGESRRFLQLDMSEYMEEHSVAKLIGSPPGYVGHEKEGLLISALRTHPHCVVLFDEVEKAHPKVFDLFLQIFDEGRLSGAHGKSADFTQSVVILTSNVDVRPPAPVQRVGFGREAESQAPEFFDPRDALRGWMRAEMVNRFDAVIPFRPLEPEALRAIAAGYVAEIEQRLKARGLSLKLGEGVFETILEAGDPAQYGARELRRVVDQLVRQSIARVVVDAGDGGGTIRLALSDSGLEVHLDPPS